MRKPRLLGGENSVYHCMSRVVDRNYIFGDMEKGCFMTILRKLEVFSGVRVLTHCLMSNHFHVLVQVPEAETLDAEEIFRRVRVLYGSFKEREEREMVERLRSHGGPEAAVTAYLSKYTRRMYDLCSFMRELKQRFTQWYNRKNKRTGTLWEDRYKSVLVEHTRSALGVIARYIDLNPVRAGLCADPKDYRWCGYGAAVGGDKQAGLGMRRLYGVLGFGERRIGRLLERYRTGLALEGEARFDRETVRQALDDGGKLSLPELLRCRVRYFSDGVALGSQAFVNGVFSGRMDFFGPKRRQAGRAMRGGAWDGLCTVRDFRSDVLRC